MTGLLAREIQQRTPFASPAVEAHLALLRTAELLRREAAEVLRPHGLSATGYNVLRILRGAGAAGLTCGEVAARLVTLDPDVTRLADRLAAAGLIERQRKPGDRRAVVLRITEAGRRLAADLEPGLAACHRRTLAHLGDAALAVLIDLLEDIRRPLSHPKEST